MAQPQVGNEDFAPGHHVEDSQLGPSIVEGSDLQHANSTMSQSHTLTLSRGGTLKKRQSLIRKNSLKRSGSKKGSRPSSVRSLTLADGVNGHESEMHSAFFTPVPTTGSPTDILANRFQVWRKVLKDLITYFRDIQKAYEGRSKTLYTLSNVISNITAPPQFVTHGGIGDAIHILRDYHQRSISEGNKARSIEEDVIVQLTGLRSDLAQKIKEIKGLSGDFKNNVDKETEGTRKAVHDLQDALGSSSTDPKSDPYLVRLGVERQLGRQIEEENYLHRAFLNLESSGRELESIVMGEIQKAYNAYTGIIKREADEAYETVERLRNGPLAISKDFEWNAFVDANENFVDPRLPIRRVENIIYHGKDDAAASEVKAGMLERKSKYLKSYTAGWYVLSTTHLHEFKSPDRIASQAPVMSLALADQKLGSHSNADSTSHKFMLKGRQSGGLHRGHAWVFRAESFDTMLAWFSDIRNLTEKTGAERNAFIQRSHARSVSAGSHKAGSVSSDGMEEDEADQVPYSATPSLVEMSVPQEKHPHRPNPGGRFPSALNVDRDSHLPISPSSNASSGDREVVAASGALPGSGVLFDKSEEWVQPRDNETSTAGGDFGMSSGMLPHEDAYTTFKVKSNSVSAQKEANLRAGKHSEYGISPMQAHKTSSDGPASVAYSANKPMDRSLPHHVVRHDSKYGDWMGTAITKAGGGVIGAPGIGAWSHQHDDKKVPLLDKQPESHTVESENVALESSLAEKTMGSPVQGAIFAPVTPSTAITNSSVVNADQSIQAVVAVPNPHLNDPAAPIKELAEVTERPSLGGRVDTISDLHLPGEFPTGR